jgi:two-component system sensor kinase FixL
MAEALTDAELTALRAQAILLDQQGIVVRAMGNWDRAEAPTSTLWRAAKEGVDYLAACDVAAKRGESGAREVAAAVRLALTKEKGRFSVEYRVETPFGNRRCFCQGAAVDRAEGRLVAALHLDISSVQTTTPPSRESLAEVAHADRLATIGRLAAGIIHELRQPLSAISLYAGALRSEGAADWSDSRVQEGIARIAESAELGGRIVDRLRTFMRNGSVAESFVDLRESVSDALTFMQFELQRSQILCTTILPKEPLWVRGDAVLLTQVLLNLVRNAVDACGDFAAPDRRVRIEARSLDRRWVEVVIQDSGVGVAAEAKDRLFDPFFTTKPDGMGVGLSLCQSIVELHGGRIRYLEAEQGASGATFVVKLPATPGAPS